jgi:hypothetical protein
VKGKCSRLNVLIVAETQRFHFNLKKTGQYIVRTVLENIEIIRDRYLEERGSRNLGDIGNNGVMVLTWKCKF